jgi:hypothetical protein
MKGPMTEFLVPVGRTLLLGSFGLSLVQSIRGRTDLELPFERLVVGMLALSLYDTAGLWLQAVSDQLTAAIAELGREDDLKALLLTAFQKAADAPAANGQATAFNIPAVIEQAWRTGVWGVMSALVEGAFLVVSFVLECARDVLWQIILFVFPLAAGVFPVLPRLLANLCLYAVELSLWLPTLCIVERVTGAVAKTHLTEIGSLGLSILGIELVAIVLILAIPSVTHKLLSGAVSGDFGAQGSALGWAKGAIIEGRTRVLTGDGGAP